MNSMKVAWYECVAFSYWDPVFNHKLELTESQGVEPSPLKATNTS